MLPLAVLAKAQRDLLALPGTGISILEISHRSKQFGEIIEQAEFNLRKLLAIPEDYRVLFMQGGASTQFATIPMNFLAGSGKAADFILTGTWGKKAIKEAKTQGDTRVVWDGAETNYDRVPAASDLDFNPDAAYCYFVSNETIQGVQFPAEPDTGEVPLICDCSSDIMCRPIPIERYGMIFACAQKNCGPAGVTIVIIREDLLERSPATIPSMLNYRVFAEGKSLMNTPPCFPIYIVKLVTDWLLEDIGGLEKMAQINEHKVELVYDAINKCAGFYEAHAQPGSRSLMNVAFRLANTELDGPFLDQAASRKLAALKGHRSVGGCRASIYNAMPTEGVQLLHDFMIEFAEKNG